MMRADQLIEQYSMAPHEEQGLYIERHFPFAGTGRAPSGHIYYYVAPGEHTDFHRIDCDEYWIYSAGETLELWVIGLDGTLSVKRCGAEAGAEPCVRFAAGEIFASRLPADAPDGSFVTCVTVPRFTYEGFELFEKEKMCTLYPETATFWE